VNAQRRNADRYLAVPGFVDHLGTNYHARTAQVFGELGYRLAIGRASVETFANVAYGRALRALRACLARRTARVVSNDGCAGKGSENRRLLAIFRPSLSQQ
jgi:hypothetical protein